MSKAGEICLIQHLNDPDSLRVLATEGLDLRCVYTEALRPIVSFALDYYHRNGRVKAPSVAAILNEESFANTLADEEISLEYEPEDSIEWAIDDLKASYLHHQHVSFVKQLAPDMAAAIGFDEKVKVIATATDSLARIKMAVERKNQVVDFREGLADRLLAYRSREADQNSTYGMSFGLHLVDQYTAGIHDGELAVMASGAKVGKSYFMAYAGLQDWNRGRAVALYTLENSVEMTLDRIACLSCGISPIAWERGQVDPDQIELVERRVEEIQDSQVPFFVLQPSPGERTAAHLVRDAQLRGAQSLLIDQLSFIESPAEDSRQPRHIQVRNIAHTLKTMISSGRDRMPCLLNHQINREGVRAAHKRGHYDMSDLAESAEVERTADWVFGLYQSFDQQATQEALFHTMAARRAPWRHFTLIWNVETGAIHARSETTLEA